jgi:hypothetical protein
MLLNLHKKSWNHGLTLDDFEEHHHRNETVVTEMLELAKAYNKVHYLASFLSSIDLSTSPPACILSLELLSLLLIGFISRFLSIFLVICSSSHYFLRCTFHLLGLRLVIILYSVLVPLMSPCFLFFKPLFELVRVLFVYFLRNAINLEKQGCSECNRMA